MPQRSPLRNLLRLEAETLAELREAVRESAEDAAALIGVEGRSRAELIIKLRKVADRLEEGLNEIIVTARNKATLLVIEANSELPEPDEDPEDEARAESIARSLAAAFLMLLLALSLTRKREVRRVVPALDARMRRIAATEVFQAYSQSALRSYAQLEVGLKRWDATLDKRTCPRCRAHDGETVALTEEFSNDEAPGDIHPNCRCIVTLVPDAEPSQ